MIFSIDDRVFAASEAWNAVGAPTESMETAVIWLAGWTVFLFGLALRFIKLDR
jgi:hypothetical protein